MVEVSTSILSINQENSIKTFYDLEVAKTDYFHIDVMDGEFVTNNTIEKMQAFSSQLKQISNIPLDVHLMVNDVKSFINAYLPYEPNIITFHLEACKDKEEALALIKFIKENNSKVGIAIKPNTEVEKLYEYLPSLHNVLVMTVEPGYGGQKLIPATIEKVRCLKQYAEDNNSEIDIEVDGGINLENVESLKEAGANMIVAGTAIVSSENYKETIQQLKQ